jgi:hypothetical protein
MNQQKGKGRQMKTQILIMTPGKPHERTSVDLPNEPNYKQLEAVIRPLLDGADLEHVNVLADFNGGSDYRPADMFVDEIGLIKRLPRNEAATRIYRRATLLNNPAIEPERLSFIAGVAILFERKVWT